MKVVFMGTPDFAVECLEALMTAGHEVVCVITQPDRPKGRGNKLSPPPVKERALALGLTVYQPTTVKDDTFLALLASYQPEVIVVVAYGRILPQSVLDLPPYGCLNVHASLLPKYRGAAPIQWTILNGDSEAGVTIMQLDKGMDTGDMLSKASLRVEPEDTTGSLFEKLAHLGAKLLVQTLSDLSSGQITPKSQDEALATYAPMLGKADECLDWHSSAVKLHNQVRGLSPAPGAYTWCGGQRLKIWRTQPQPDETDGRFTPGQIVQIQPDYFAVCTGEGLLRVYEVQPAGKKVMPVGAFLNGAGLEIGSKLGAWHE